MANQSELRVDMGSIETMTEPLSPSAVVYVRTHAAHILVTIGINSATNVDTFRAQLPSALNHPRFSSLMVGDVEKNEELKWVQIPRLNIDDHIIVPKINLSLVNGRLAGDKYVEDYLHYLTKTSLDTSKPLWEFHLLDIKTSESESIWILRIHHAIGDGVSIASHVLAWTRQASNPNSLPTIAGMKKKKKTETETTKYRCWKFLISFILMALWWVKAIWNTIVDVTKFSTIYFVKDSEILVMANMETGSKERRIAYKIFDLDDIKFIKNAMKVTVNDVALGIIEAGLSRTLNRMFGDGNKKEVKKPNDVLDKARLRITMPVNLRPIKGIENLNDIKNKDTKLGLANEVGFVVMPLSTRLRDDPLEYVRKAKIVVDRKKHSFGAKVNITLGKVAAKCFGFKLIGQLTAKIFSHVTIGIFNVPGAVEEINFFSHPVKFFAPTVYGIPIPIMIHLQSYTNRMSMIIAVRENVILDPHEILEDIKQSLLLIKATLIK